MAFLCLFEIANFIVLYLTGITDNITKLNSGIKNYNVLMAESSKKGTARVTAISEYNGVFGDYLKNLIS